MKFDELDRMMRVFETAHDHSVLPGIHMVVRLDGRSFTRLTKELLTLEAPFDPIFRDHMIATAIELMERAGINVRYGYTESDEISLLLSRDETAFGRKLRKLTSVLAGHASGFMSLRLGQLAVFDCRVSQLPGEEQVVDYFRWRNEDAHRNALSAHCYWALRKLGMSGAEANAAISGLSNAEKNELLFRRSGINFNDLPAWQRRGVGLVWERHQKGAALRRRVAVDLELPMKDAYSARIRELLGAPADAAAEEL